MKQQIVNKWQKCECNIYFITIMYKRPINGKQAAVIFYITGYHSNNMIC